MAEFKGLCNSFITDFSIYSKLGGTLDETSFNAYMNKLRGTPIAHPTFSPSGLYLYAKNLFFSERLDSTEMDWLLFYKHNGISPEIHEAYINTL